MSFPGCPSISAVKTKALRGNFIISHLLSSLSWLSPGHQNLNSTFSCSKHLPGGLCSYLPVSSLHLLHCLVQGPITSLRDDASSLLLHLWGSSVSTLQSVLLQLPELWLVVDTFVCLLCLNAWDWAVDSVRIMVMMVILMANTNHLAHKLSKCQASRVFCRIVHLLIITLWWMCHDYFHFIYTEQRDQGG